VAPPIISMTAAPGGGLWLSQRAPTLAHLDAAGRFQPQITDPQHACYRLVTTPDGTLWCGGNKGLLRITRPPHFEVIPLPDSGKSVRGLAVTPSGAVVAGHYGGVSIFRNGNLQKHWSRGRDLLDDRIQCLGADDRQIWFGYDDLQAFTRIRYDKDPPEIQHFNSHSGHQGAGSVFFHIDRKGRIWRGGTDAIYVSDGQAVAPDDWVRLGEAESWPFDDPVQNAVFEDTDGSLWFGTDKGLLHYTPPPDLFEQLRTPTTIALTAVAFDKQPAAIVELAPTKLQGGGHSVQLHFSALHYANPKEHRYRYRLFPREKEWTTTDQFQVAFPDLPHGDYRFEVHGRAENRAWSATPATFAFSLQAPFYATSWFLGSTGTLSFTALFLGARRYQHRRARRQREQRIKQLFLKALDLSPEARAAFLDAAPDVATELRSMLENATPQDPTAESRVLPIGEVFEHRYEIERWIGSGGFSHVYLARDRKLSHRPTAIKVHQSRHAAQPELIAQIKREIATLSKLDHPHIVDIYDTGLTPDGRLFLAMEYIDGPSLRQLDLPLEPARVARLMQQLADAVEAAHHAGIIHRDLKPGNVLLRNAGTPLEHLMVIDFGLATPTGAATQPMLAATPDYMAPEQHQGRAYPATDVHAMALIAFELLTGKRCTPILRDGGSIAGHLPAAVVAVLEQALAADPTARPSPLHFVERLEKFGREPGDLRT
jgi:tRNA A-37 threonylcarbamoyl transferase component Bud32